MNLYCITFPNGKRYFGIETNTGNRWRSHKCSAKLGSMLPVHKAIRKYGPENCKFSYIYQGIEKEYAIKLEIQFIKSYNTTDCSKGYNVSPGGESWSPPKIVRDKLSAKTKACFALMSPEERARRGKLISIANKGKAQSPERRLLSIIAANRPRTYLPETIKERSDRKKKWWADRKAAGLTGNIAYTKNPQNKPEPKPKIVRATKWQRLKPVTEEHKQRVAEKKKQWWAARKGKSWEETFGRPKKSGYRVTFTPEHRAKLSAAAKARYSNRRQTNELSLIPSLV